MVKTLPSMGQNVACLLCTQSQRPVKLLRKIQWRKKRVTDSCRTWTRPLHYRFPRPLLHSRLARWRSCDLTRPLLHLPRTGRQALHPEVAQNCPEHRRPVSCSTEARKKKTSMGNEYGLLSSSRFRRQMSAQTVKKYTSRDLSPASRKCRF